MPQISLCMIAKDEEPNIARCLKSAGQVADELIVVDTGSTDATPALCQEMGARVFSFPWAGDFAQARNFGLEKAQGEWVLWLDADEELIIHDRAALLAQLEGTHAQALSVSMRHFYGVEPLSDRQVYFSRAPRLFRNKAGLTFQGRVHERLTAMAEEPLWVEATDALRIDHDGYREEKRIPKSLRNLDLLLREWSEGGESPWLAYHIAVELHRSGKMLESYQMANEAIRRFLERELLPPALLYKLKYETLMMTGHYQEAYPAVDKAIALYPDYTDLHFYKGFVLLQTGQAGEAADAFRRCLALGDGNPKYLTMRGMGSYFALYYLGACQEALGEQDAALASYRQAAALYPESELFQARLDALSHTS